MIAIKGILFFSVFLIAASLSPHPGATIRLSTAAIDNAVKSVIDVLNQHIQDVQIPDESQKQHHLHLEAKNIKLEKFNIDKNKVNVLTNADNTVSFNAEHIEFKVSFHYRVHKKHLFSKSGHCSISVGNGRIGAALRLNAQNGHPELSVVSKNANMGDLHYKCHGDLFDHIVNWLSKVIKPKIKKAIDDGITSAITQAFPKINQKLAEIPTDRPLSKGLSMFHVDYSIFGQPILTPQMTRIDVLSQFYLDGHKNDAPASVFPTPGAFPSDPPSRDFCVNIDLNLVFKSAAYAFSNSDKSTFHFDKPIFGKLPESKRQFFECDCTGEFCLVTILPDLKQTCAPGQTVDLHGTVQLGADIGADNRGLIITANATSVFKLGTDVDHGPNLLSLNASIGVILEKSIKIENWNVFGHVSVFQTHLTASTLAGPIASELVEKIWNFALADLAQNVINEAFGAGIPLPPLKFISLSNVEFTFKGALIEICSNVDIDFNKLIHI